MSFNPKEQAAQAERLLKHYLIATQQDKHIPLVEQRTTLRDLAIHMYAVAYQEGWEDARTKP